MQKLQTFKVDKFLHFMLLQYGLSWLLPNLALILLCLATFFYSHSPSLLSIHLILGQYVILAALLHRKNLVFTGKFEGLTHCCMVVDQWLLAYCYGQLPGTIKLSNNSLDLYWNGSLGLYWNGGLGKYQNGGLYQYVNFW